MTKLTNKQAGLSLALILATAPLFVAVESAHAVEQDKKLHFNYSVVFGLVASTVTQDTEHPLLYAAAMGVMPGLVKEIMDSGSTGGSGFSRADMKYNIAGSLLGASVGRGVYISRRMLQYRSSF